MVLIYNRLHLIQRPVRHIHHRLLQKQSLGWSRFLIAWLSLNPLSSASSISKKTRSGFSLEISLTASSRQSLSPKISLVYFDSANISIHLLLMVHHPLYMLSTFCSKTPLLSSGMEIVMVVPTIYFTLYR